MRRFNLVRIGVGSISGFMPVSQIAQETCIKEVIDLAVSASQDRPESENLERLRKLLAALDVFEIRNAVCRPNRPYPECYCIAWLHSQQILVSTYSDRAKSLHALATLPVLREAPSLRNRSTEQ